MLRVNSLSKNYNGRVIFQAVNCEVYAGQILVITGSNGSGKSTLLKILCGLLSPTRGDVWWSIAGQEQRPKEAMNKLGYLSPEIGLYDRLTAAEHIGFFAALRGINRGEAWVKDALRRVQLAEYARYPVGQFSSGMKQRMKLACALVHDPRVLVLDEPSSNLDKQGLDLLDSVIAEQQNKGLVILATNEEREVAKYGQALLHLGKSNCSS